jgi:type III restriction enzyme
MDGKRQIERYIPEVDGVTIQDLPEENLRRYAFKMATGSGKTVVMAMAAVWSYFHKRLVPGSDLSANFLILAPNVIVYQRLEKDFVRQLEAEGVGIKTTTTPPDPPVKVEPVLEKAAFDIAIPLTRPVYTHNYKRLSEFDPQNLAAIYDQDELEETHRIRLKMDFATTETEVHQEEIAAGPAPLAQDILASITNKTIAAARLPGGFSDLFSIVRNYVTHRCFGQPIDIDDEKIRDYLRAPLVQEGIAKYLARKIAELTAEKRAIEFEPRRCCQ